MASAKACDKSTLRSTDRHIAAIRATSLTAVIWGAVLGIWLGWSVACVAAGALLSEMRRVTVAVLALASMVGTPVHAQQQKQQMERHIARLWDEMGRQRLFDLRDDMDLGVLLGAMIRQQDYVCDFAFSMLGEGDSPRGRFAGVQCGGTLAYRVELWADKNRYTVRPWIHGVDGIE